MYSLTARRLLMKPRSALVLCFAILCVPALLVGGPGNASRARARVAALPLPEGREGLPPGASIQTVLPNIHSPVAMAFDPQGRLFYTEKDTGNVRLYANGALQPNPVINFPVSISS